MAHEHDLDAEFLYPSDAAVTGIEEGPDGLTITLLVPCPECDEAIEVTAVATGVEDTDQEFPVYD